MDSITQAALGALCGELILGKKLGNYGLLWGALVGTLPDLDIIAYAWLSPAEQLGWHRGISHSILMMFVAAAIIGWLMHKFYQHRTTPISYTRAAWFVFLTWSTHVLIDCFNTYGTMILEPFSSERIAIGNMFIIDLFFLIPILLCLILCIIKYRQEKPKRFKAAKLTSCWLIFYFTCSLFTKHLAGSHFENMLDKNAIRVSQMMTAPTFSNIFLWRMVAKDEDGETIHTSYWSLFDNDDDKPVILSLQTTHHLEEAFSDSTELKAIRAFTNGWHKTYQLESDPDSIYIAALNMGEMHIQSPYGNELRPVFIWKVSRKPSGGYDLERAFKMTTDGSKHMRSAVKKTLTRALGNTDNWLKGNIIWTWETDMKKVN